MYPEGGNDARKCESENHSSGSSPKTRFAPISANATIPPDSINAILRQPRAIVIASRLHYLILLLRTVASDNISIEYWHQYLSQ
jgi:hypothetical protein